MPIQASPHLSFWQGLSWLSVSWVARTVLKVSCCELRPWGAVVPVFLRLRASPPTPYHQRLAWLIQCSNIVKERMQRVSCKWSLDVWWHLARPFLNYPIISSGGPTLETTMPILYQPIKYSYRNYWISLAALRATWRVWYISMFIIHITRYQEL